MADLPITFSGSMVRAILREIEKPGTGKTQTRRVLNPQPYSPESIVYVDQNAGKWMSCEPSPVTGGTRQMDPWRKLKCAPGDRLYVREHWRTDFRFDVIPPSKLDRTLAFIPPYSTEWPTDDQFIIGYEATEPGVLNGRFRQAMHMPKWSSRISLIVTDVRVERLQDCSDEDAIAEGIQINGWHDIMCNGMTADLDGAPRCDCGDRSNVETYAALWDEINGPGAWAKNPWIVAYTFRPILGNIDQIGVVA